MSRVKQSKAELEKHLKEQISFLIASCTRYDAGYPSEAKRLAATLRVLFHDTRRSMSLLRQVQIKKGLWLDTGADYDSANLLSFVALISVRVKTGRLPQIIPRGSTKADDISHENFNRWWTRAIIVAVKNSEKRIHYSRENLVLNVANTDGGAHVDASLEELFQQLSRKDGVGYFGEVRGEKVPLLRPELPCIRQIAHEVILTLHERRPDLFNESYDSDFEVIPPIDDIAIAPDENIPFMAEFVP